MASVDFWYDFSSPFSYLGATQIERVAAGAGAELTWRPMLLGAVFKQIGGPDVPILSMSEAKRNYYLRDLHHWAALWEVPFKFTSRFPVRTVTALRLALAAGDQIARLSLALYRAVWVDDRDVNDPAVLTDVLTAEGFDAADMLARTQDPAIKQQLFDNTSEAVAAGVFGAPTCIVKGVGDDMLFWGQDRLELVGKALGGWRPDR